MKDDPEIKAGWGPLNLNFLFKPWAWLTVVWHDEITSKDSFAQKACIDGDRVAEAWDAQLEVASQKTEDVIDDIIAAVAGPTMKEIQRPFYEGPHGMDEVTECLIREGRNPDGTKI